MTWQRGRGWRGSEASFARPSSAAWPTWPPCMASRVTFRCTHLTCCSSTSECPPLPQALPTSSRLSMLPLGPGDPSSPGAPGPPRRTPGRPRPPNSPPPACSLGHIREADCRAFTGRAAQGDTELLANLPDQRAALQHSALACLVGPGAGQEGWKGPGAGPSLTCCPAGGVPPTAAQRLRSAAPRGPGVRHGGVQHRGLGPPRAAEPAALPAADPCPAGCSQHTADQREDRAWVGGAHPLFEASLLEMRRGQPGVWA